VTGMLEDRRRTPGLPSMPALTDAECSVIDHYLAVVDLTARINPARGNGHTYPACGPPSPWSPRPGRCWPPSS
jgi:hypothetical protein